MKMTPKPSIPFPILEALYRTAQAGLSRAARLPGSLIPVGWIEHIEDYVAALREGERKAFIAGWEKGRTGNGTTATDAFAAYQQERKEIPR